MAESKVETTSTAGAAPSSGDSGGVSELAIATVRTVPIEQAQSRTEHDLLGKADVPDDRATGASTPSGRSMNFPITGVPVGHFPDFVRALALVKQAAARAQSSGLGYLPAEKAAAIDSSLHRDRQPTSVYARIQFVVDAIQGGAGTSTNMNTNEVIANVALELMGASQGRLCDAASRTTTSTWRSRPTMPIRQRCGSRMIFATQPLIERARRTRLRLQVQGGGVRRCPEDGPHPACRMRCR